MGKDSVIATVFYDDNKKYLSTDLMGKEPVKQDFLSTEIHLTGFRSFKRVCQTCCNPAECEEARYAKEIGTSGLPFCSARACI